MISLQGLEIVDDFLPLELGSTDVILGVQWLQTLGNTYHNWTTHTMKFIIGGKNIMLKGDPTLQKTRISESYVTNFETRGSRCNGGTG